MGDLGYVRTAYYRLTHLLYENLQGFIFLLKCPCNQEPRRFLRPGGFKFTQAVQQKLTHDIEHNIFLLHVLS